VPFAVFVVMALPLTSISQVIEVPSAVRWATSETNAPRGRRSVIASGTRTCASMAPSVSLQTTCAADAEPETLYPTLDPTPKYAPPRRPRPPNHAAADVGGLGVFVAVDTFVVVVVAALVEAAL
jgi:hypothetical protein